MNIRTLATLAVAILLGLIAVVLVRNYMGRAGRPGAGPGAVAAATVPVVVAAQPIARGAALEAPQLKVANFPQDSAPPGAFSTIAELTGAAGAKRLALRGLVPGEPILSAKISGPGGKLTLSVVLTDGMRAVALRSNDVAGVGGFVLPGDRVDVLLTRADRSDSEATTVTQVLAENVRVLGVDQSDNDETGKPAVARTVTIEVTPDQAQTVALAQAVGSVSLALRHVADDAVLRRRSTTVAALGHFAPARPGAAGATRPLGRGMVLVRVTRGVDTSGYPVSAY